LEGEISNFNRELFDLETSAFSGDMCVEIRLEFSDGTPICQPERTDYVSFAENVRKWGKSIHFPVKYNELPDDAMLSFIVWDINAPMKQSIIGSATLPLFGNKGKLKVGPYKIRLNLFEYPDIRKISSPVHPSEDDLVKIEQLARSVPSEYRIEWLDIYTFQKIKRMKQRRQTNTSKPLLLNIELPMFEYPVMNQNILDNVEKQELSSETRQNVKDVKAIDPLSDKNTESIDAANKSSDQFRVEFNIKDFDWIDDREVKQDNLVEEKHLKLSIGKSNTLIDKDLKPNAEELRKIQKILDYPPLHEISMEDKSLLWNFRYYLRSNKRALIKFLRCVDWSFAKEMKEATNLIEQWAEISSVDALALLSRFFKHIAVVRDYAVSILTKADDDEILDVLLQLVQALRYEVDSGSQINTLSSGIEKSKLAQFLFRRGATNFVIANKLYWYLRVESEDPKCGDIFGHLFHKFRIHLKRHNQEFLEKLERQNRLVRTLEDLGKTLKAMKDSRPKRINALKKILSSKEGPWNWEQIFNANISKLFSPGPLTFPLSPTILVTGIMEEKATIFKSAMNPMLLPFKVYQGDIYYTIFKTGDDLRQDQLIIQLITLMDKLLKRNGLDLKLTPYPVLACGRSYGFLECVTPSAPISYVISQGDIKSYLRKHNETDSGFEQACLNFIYSCAGYCVITYILGIGDRHLDNVLLTPKGNMFHIDFGFILGRDPKPFAPPMKLCKEMVEGMGGSGSEGYMTFKQLCCTAYNILRKNADLILNMFILMADASIPDIENNVSSNSSININQDTAKIMDTPIKNIMKVQDKFKLELNDAQAVIFMQSIINESEKALFPQVTETIHRWVQYWRS
jgi:phosphatidylinositol 3-kinase